FDPYGKNKFAICRICKSSVHQPGSHYCQGCAYKKGEMFAINSTFVVFLEVYVIHILISICAMCGKKVLDTKNYKQTSV
ncbi:hypothetical protein JD844_025408, partial [Phrynosoma platyrhinos]